jgi:outer membrane protein TolC
LIGFQSLGLNVLTQSSSTIGSVGPALYLPIFTGGRLTGELRGARAQYEEAVGNYNQTIVKALQDVADAALSKKSLTSRLIKTGDALNAATDAYRVARERYEGSLSSYLEVLTAEDAMLSNMRLLTDLQSRAFTLDIALTRALGGGYKNESAIAN